MKKVQLNQLSDEDKKALMKELEEEQKKHQQKISEDRANYKQLVDGQVTQLFPALQEASQSLSVVKKHVFDNLKTLISLKAELYNREEEQFSHSFTNTDGTITITIGYNQNDGWDDTVNTGIAKVHDYINSLAKDRDTKALVDTVLKLLSKDAKGTLKASRVLQLKQMADKTGNKEFIDAIQIIQDAYRPMRSKEFIRCEYKGENGQKLILPLSITDAPILIVEEAKTC